MCHFFHTAILAALLVAGGDNPLTPVEARKKVGEKITVEMTVQTAKDRLAIRGEIYLDAELDFRDEKNFAVVITKAGAAKLKEAGIDDPATHFMSKKIRATGTVKEVQNVPRIEIDDAKQIRLVKATNLSDETKKTLKRIEQLGGHAKPPLPGIALGDTKVTDAGLAHLKALRGVQRLDLSKTPITDAGLLHLHSLTDLRVLDVRETKATPDGMAALRKAVPGVRILMLQR